MYVCVRVTFHSVRIIHVCLHELKKNSLTKYMYNDIVYFKLILWYIR